LPDKLNLHTFGGLKFLFCSNIFLETENKLFLFIIFLSSGLKYFKGSASIGDVALSRTEKKNTEDSQFFILLEDAPLFEGEYSPVGKVIYGLEFLQKN
jgi:cyclophilin family peptidyl-prolyl cis-trans isomerase